MTDPDQRAGLLLAAWPGMGSVALLAAVHLIDQLDGQEVECLPVHEWFPPSGIDVADGLVSATSAPGCRLFRCPGSLPDGSDLLVFIGEAQPDHDGYGLCRALVQRAMRRGVRRCVTCAAMAGAHRPGDDPRVLAAATTPELLTAARRAGAVPLEEGRISGLNGLLLSAAADQGCEGLCLLGEMPFYATGIPNPSAALACLVRLCELSGIVIRFDELARQAAEVDRRLTAAVEQAEAAPGIAGPAADQEPSDESEGTTETDPALHHHLESLFAAAAEDRDRALELKRLLDQHNLFEDYEDRFLDLFKRTE